MGNPNRTDPDISTVPGRGNKPYHEQDHTTSACLGDNALDVTEAARVAEFLGLGPEIAEALTACA